MTDDSTQWEAVGRRAVSTQLNEARFDVEGVLRELAGDLRDGENIDVSDVRDARIALNTARRVLEEQVAPVAGGEPWSEPVPEIPMWKLWELSHHPKAEDTDGDDDE